MLTLRAPVLLRSLSTAPVVLRRGVASSALAENDSLSKARPFSEVPSPRGAIPLLGHLPLLANKSGKERFELFGRLLKELGPIVRLKLPLKKNMILLSNPAGTEKVLCNDGQYPVRATSMSQNFQYLYKDMDLPTPFVFLEGKEWKDMRSLHEKQIHPANVHSYSPGINRATDRLLTALEASRNEDGYVEDIYPHVINWTMEATAWFALGIDLDLTKENSEETKQFQQSIRMFMRSIDYMIEAIPFYKIYPTKKYKEVKESIATVHLLGRKYVEQKRASIEKRLREGGSTHNGLSLIEQWMIEGNMSEEQCIISALDMITAGVDTTANYTTFVLYQLAKHPEVHQKVRQQVVSVLGEDGEADPESLPRMPYLRDVIRETHRVRPVINGFFRELTKEIELMGYRIPAGTNVLCCTPSCGAGALRFDPDRWTRDEDKPHPFADLPFGSGPRSCFGQCFAELEMKILLTKMIRRFNMSVDGPSDADLPVELETIFRSAAPVKIKLSSRV